VANLVALAAATAILVAIPGPIVGLIVANSVRHGPRVGFVTVMGTTLGNALQLLLVVLGMAALIELAADALSWIRWAGVVYLVYLGIRSWNEPAGELRGADAAPAVFWRGCAVAVVNPKSLLFNAAFLPQFIAADGGLTGHPAVVAAVFLLVLSIGDALWALFAGSARHLLDRYASVRNRITGGFLVAAGLGLALARR
jgi:threonine/homoserine/homoserine lactone efflux protein